MNAKKTEVILARFSLGRAIFWAALLVPSYLFGWIYSVGFIALCSLYANAAGDFSAYRSDSSKRLDVMEATLRRIERKLDEQARAS